jgi:hypothetical protein
MRSYENESGGGYFRILMGVKTPHRRSPDHHNAVTSYENCRNGLRFVACYPRSMPTGTRSSVPRYVAGMSRGKWRPACAGIRLTETREITPHVWVHPDDER